MPDDGRKAFYVIGMDYIGPKLLQIAAEVATGISVPQIDHIPE